MKPISIVLAASMCLAPFTAKALEAELKILDCQGVARVVTAAKANQVHNLRVELQNIAAKKVNLTAKNSLGKTKTGATDNALATIESVEPGTWTLCTDAEDVLIENVAIIAPDAYSQTWQASKLAIPLGIGGAIAGGLAMSAGSGSSSDTAASAGTTIISGPSVTELTGTPDQQIVPSKPSGKGPRGSTHERCLQKARVADVDCFIGDDEEVLSPFS